ncbi:hypothetical protein [Marmoricola sp. URHB0036]|uniref:hypothetical protein n=1 Tax=Marmoricola sp. URHB0036 TaxID=1298863 RepID=UPI0012DCC4D6|nr:hypothetical protein [Marmoricola sp. URHB0036]
MAEDHRADKRADNQDERRSGERERAIAWLDEKWTGSRACPICGTVQWTITEAVEIRPWEEGNLVFSGGSGTYPLFQLICNNCAFTRLFNAVMSGVTPTPPEVAEDREAIDGD